MRRIAISCRSPIHHLLIVLAITFLGGGASAYVELNGFYFSDSFKPSTQNQSSWMLLDVSLGFSVDRNSRYRVGWNYTMHTITEKVDTADLSYSTAQMGPRFIYSLDKAGLWTLGLTYNLNVTTTFNDGSGAKTLRGTSLKVDFGYSFYLNEVSQLGLRLNYATSLYSESLVGSTDYSTISSNRNLIYPTIYYFWNF